MYDKKEFPILVQLAPTDDDKEAALQTQIDNNALVIKSLNADLRAAAADLAAEQERNKALEAENTRLRLALSIIGNAINLTKHATEMGIDCSQHTNPATTMCAIAHEALQAKEAE